MTSSVLRSPQRGDRSATVRRRDWATPASRWLRRPAQRPNPAAPAQNAEGHEAPRHRAYPYRRILESPQIDAEAKNGLTRTYLGLNPAQLKREIGRCRDRLLELARTKQEPKEVIPAPDDRSGRRSLGGKFRGHLR